MGLRREYCNTGYLIFPHTADILDVPPKMDLNAIKSYGYDQFVYKKDILFNDKLLCKILTQVRTKRK